MFENSSDPQQQILRYLQRNPRAAETPRGVNRVWLHRPHTPDALAEVERALRGLASVGELEQHDLPGGEKVFRLVEGRK